GHYMRDCRKRLAEQSQGGNERGAEGNQRSERAPATPRKLAFALMDKSRLKDWHIDTGSGWHITYDASELQNVRTVRPEEIFSVTGYDGSKQQPTHVGRYTLKSNVDDNLEIELDNVYVVPNAMVKLISAGTLDERGVVFEFGDGKAEVRFKGETSRQEGGTNLRHQLWLGILSWWKPRMCGDRVWRLSGSAVASALGPPGIFQ
ncbi:hypothetical protein Vretifemale_20410, partial [Volvox reticuliferus]